MSVVHDPIKKKKLFYLRDRRFDGFDNPHCARLAIARHKRHVNKVNRLAVANVLAQAPSLEAVEDLVDEVGQRCPKRWKTSSSMPLASKGPDRSELARSLLEGRSGKR
ncbi:MAG: hypothetical protein ACYCWW_18470 [Deltaproteobacteria bacterium]